ncbi:uncharacterized protein LOC131673301 [Phymastichus coffea]|uniref:uncharacterized protein LOC131673301 n=1 Tax=Phymastichus coffea TaxID=108790 RepID=UPI00273C31EE|nr:uncharacterized protein LOC131673301 [Phymastichus coffea]
MGHDKNDHDCRLNYLGSAKGMETDAGVQLINHSNILKEAKLQVRVIIGDEDSSMIAAVRKDNPYIYFYKLVDRNHMVKNFGKVLYEMQENYKQMKKKGVVPHIKKCFAYAVSQNKGNSDRLARELRRMPEHLYGRHENCGFWCKYKEKHTILLTDENLYTMLVDFFNKYAANAGKFSVAASSQANESFNNVIAHKAHKNQCLRRSEACDFRVGNGVCAWNYGEKCMAKFRMRVNLSEGLYTLKYATTADGKRFTRKQTNTSSKAKLRRVILKQQRESLRKSLEKSEGITYQANCGMEIEINLPEKSNADAKPLIVYFDLETTGLDINAEIVQIAAKCGKYEFDFYINPTKEISKSATKFTGLSNDGGMLCLNGKAVESSNLKDGLLAFKQFLESLSKFKKCLLVAHNASFDTRILLRNLISCNILRDFDIIQGFSDSLKAFKKLISQKKGPGQFTLHGLATEYLASEDLQNFHDAVGDVRMLEKLARYFNCKKLLVGLKQSYYDCCNRIIENNKINSRLQYLRELKGVISITYLKKLAKHNITYKQLVELYKNEGSDDIYKMFCEKVGGKVKITKDIKISIAVVNFFETN